MYFVYFINGKTNWSDTDYSIQDNTPYYPAPEGVEVGTRCKLVDGQAVADPLPQDELDKILEQQEKEFLITRHTSFVNKICENNILQKYSRDDQRNIDRDALPLKALEGIFPARLKEREVVLIKDHEQMSNYINNELKICRELKDKIKEMDINGLKKFDPKDPVHWENIKQ